MRTSRLRSARSPPQTWILRRDPVQRPALSREDQYFGSELLTPKDSPSKIVRSGSTYPQRDYSIASSGAVTTSFGFRLAGPRFPPLVAMGSTSILEPIWWVYAVSSALRDVVIRPSGCLTLSSELCGSRDLRIAVRIAGAATSGNASSLRCSSSSSLTKCRRSIRAPL